MKTEEFKRSQPNEKSRPFIGVRARKPPVSNCRPEFTKPKCTAKESEPKHSRSERVNYSEVLVEEVEDEEAYQGPSEREELPYILEELNETSDVFTKYKTVDKKVRPVKTDLPPGKRIIRNMTGDPLKDMPTLPTSPPEEFVPTGRYTLE